MVRYCPELSRNLSYRENVLLVRMDRDRIKSWRIRVGIVANRDDGLRSKENAKINCFNISLAYLHRTILFPSHQSSNPFPLSFMHS